jgi:hypothetical protein
VIAVWFFRYETFHDIIQVKLHETFFSCLKMLFQLYILNSGKCWVDHGWRTWKCLWHIWWHYSSAHLIEFPKFHCPRPRKCCEWHCCYIQFMDKDLPGIYLVLIKFKCTILFCEFLPYDYKLGIWELDFIGGGWGLYIV